MYMVEYYSTIKNKIMPLAATWMEIRDYLEIITRDYHTK